MMDGYKLPETATFGSEIYHIRWDFRVILKILDYLEHGDAPLCVRWQVALRMFYREPVPDGFSREAMEFLAAFIAGGQTSAPGPKLLDWQMDAPAIIAGVNQVAGREVRSLDALHWWTFLSFFHSIGQGQLSLLVGIRDKLRKGKKLEPQEQEFYRSHGDWVRMTRPDPEKQRLMALLDGAGGKPGCA